LNESAVPRAGCYFTGGGGGGKMAAAIGGVSEQKIQDFHPCFR